MKMKAFKHYGTVAALAVIILIFSILRPASFCTVKNFLNISRQAAPLAMVALGATFVMTINEFDLSVGNIVSLGGVIAAQKQSNFSVLEGLLTTLLGEKIIIQRLLESESNQEK